MLNESSSWPRGVARGQLHTRHAKQQNQACMHSAGTIHCLNRPRGRPDMVAVEAASNTAPDAGWQNAGWPDAGWQDAASRCLPAHLCLIKAHSPPAQASERGRHDLQQQQQQSSSGTQRHKVRVAHARHEEAWTQRSSLAQPSRGVASCLACNRLVCTGFRCGCFPTQPIKHEGDSHGTSCGRAACVRLLTHTRQN